MKQTQYLLKITALLAFLVSQSPASSLVPIGDTTATLTLSGTTVTRSILTSASGRSGALRVSKTRTAFIQFNLSGSGFSKGSYDKALLTLFFPTVTKAGTLELRLIDESWDESFPERTRPTPAVGSPFTIIQEDSVVRKQFVVVDVTAAMTDALSNGRSVFGISISSVNGVANVAISSKEGTGTGHAPELQLIPNMTVTPGVKNMAVGPLALGSITSGENNTALGHLSLLRVTTGNFNTAIGTDTLKSLVNGSDNTATGYEALARNVGGNGNTANGCSP